MCSSQSWRGSSSVRTFTICHIVCPGSIQFITCSGIRKPPPLTARQFFNTTIKACSNMNTYHHIVIKSRIEMDPVFNILIILVSVVACSILVCFTSHRRRHDLGEDFDLCPRGQDALRETRPNIDRTGDAHPWTESCFNNEGKSLSVLHRTSSNKSQQSLDLGDTAALPVLLAASNFLLNVNTANVLFTMSKLDASSCNTIWQLCWIFSSSLCF
mmetsp:Transcript_21694/g.45635  ORF Transcript_21694/g.45635 Transcript_21694/m.45635 type:complete len:214 (-) Transcript_21694:1612-2253(-)